MARSGTPARYAKSIFLNCPFDDEYRPIFRAIVFTIAGCGYLPRCTLEHEDASHVRIAKIFRLIEHSALSIHDISRTELDVANQLPRFNICDLADMRRLLALPTACAHHELARRLRQAAGTG